VAGGKDGKGGDQSKKGSSPNVPEPIKMVGGIGMELLRVSGARKLKLRVWGFL
jgi:hypothetical protein